MSDLHTQDMTVSQLQDYTAVKAATDTIAKLPLVGEIPLTAAKGLCEPLGAPVLAKIAPATCQAVKDTLGELDAPAFPKGPDAVSKATGR